MLNVELLFYSLLEKSISNTLGEIKPQDSHITLKDNVLRGQSLLRLNLSYFEPFIREYMYIMGVSDCYFDFTLDLNESHIEIALSFVPAEINEGFLYLRSYIKELVIHCITEAEQGLSPDKGVIS